MPANQARVEGVLAEPIQWRTTPAGLTTARLTLEHRSRAADPATLGGEELRLELRMAVLALGGLAEQCRTWQPGSTVLAEGRLNQQRWTRNNRLRWGQVELVAIRLDLLAAAPTPADGSSSIREWNDE